MAELTRAWSVVYGSLTIGGSNTEIKLDGPVTVRRENDSAMVSCTAIVRPSTDTDAAMETLLDAIETDMRKPRQRLRVISGATTVHDFNPATGVKTGGNAQPVFDEPGDRIADSRRSRRMTFSWTIDLNATPYAQDGRRDSHVTAVYAGTDQATITISGEYRADATYASARARYNASIGAYASTILASFSGRTFELVGKPSVTTDDTDFICTFTQIYQEILRPQALGVTDFAAIIDPKLALSLNRNHPGDSPGRTVNRLFTVTAQYSCEVDKGTSDLDGLWRDTVEPLILATVESVFSTSVAAVVDRTTTPDYYGNQLSGSLQILVTSGGSVLSYMTSWTTTDDPGGIEEPMGTGGPYDRLVYDGPATYVLEVTEQVRTLGASAGGARRASKPPFSAGAAGAGVNINFDTGDDSGTIGSTQRSLLGEVASINIKSPSGDKPTTLRGGASGAGRRKGPTGQGEWSKPVVTTTTQPTLIGEAPYQLAVTDTTTVTVRRWRNRYQAPPATSRRQGTSSPY